MATELIVGQNYFFQTCTKDWIGKLEAIRGPYTVVLSNVSWVADSGRLGRFVREGRAENMEIEYLGSDSILSCQWVNWTPWKHPLFDKDY